MAFVVVTWQMELCILQHFKRGQREDFGNRVAQGVKGRGWVGGEAEPRGGFG